MCGILGLFLASAQLDRKTSQLLPDLLRQALRQIQHRGYDGAGLALEHSAKQRILLTKGCGLIPDVLTNELLAQLSGIEFGSFGIGHTRYKTTGECNGQATQPLMNSAATLCLAHNGQIETEGQVIPDSIYLLELFEKHLDLDQLTPNHVWTVVQHIFKTIHGSYSCLLMIAGWGLVAFRDPQGIRPLIYATSETKEQHWVCSEDVPFVETGLKIRDVRPGECLIFRNSMGADARAETERETKVKPISYQWPEELCSLQPCIFEYIYLAHPTSCLNGIPVMEARQVLGELLAQKIKEQWSDLQIDYLIPVPETSVLAAEKMAEILGVPLEKKLKLNPFRKQPRSFILPTQTERVKAVQEKFLWKGNCQQEKNQNPDLTGKNILVVDDSIVRGTTLKYLLKMIRQECPGIGQIWVASVAPPTRFKNIRGIDVPDEKTLVAYQRTETEIANALGADLVIYQDLDQMLQRFVTWPVVGDQKLAGFEVGMFTGEHL